MTRAKISCRDAGAPDASLVSHLHKTLSVFSLISLDLSHATCQVEREGYKHFPPTVLGCNKGNCSSSCINAASPIDDIARLQAQKLNVVRSKGALP